MSLLIAFAEEKQWSRVQAHVMARLRVLGLEVVVVVSMINIKILI
jgi:hypothetical protein